ncbi:Uncharacterised protein [Mycobacteroides abscessus subsp. abscessus]|nr:Uncharacterised protein [Mycobacteroides abscessus subsp. abscessus]
MFNLGHWEVTAFIGIPECITDQSAIFITHRNTVSIVDVITNTNCIPMVFSKFLAKVAVPEQFNLTTTYLAFFIRTEQILCVPVFNTVNWRTHF